MDPTQVANAAKQLQSHPLVAKALRAGFSFQELIQLVIALLQALGPLLPVTPPPTPPGPNG